MMAHFYVVYSARWHLGNCDRRCLPTRRGIDEFRGTLQTGPDYFNWSKFLYILLKRKYCIEYIMCIENSNISSLFYYIRV